MAGKKVLILDDSPIVLQMAQHSFLAAGLEPLLAADLAELDRQLEQQPDLAVIDINIPEVYGDDVAAVLRGARGLSIPIVLYSSIPEAELAKRAADAGADAYVSKSAGMEGLLAKVQELLGG